MKGRTLAYDVYKERKDQDHHLAVWLHDFHIQSSAHSQRGGKQTAISIFKKHAFTSLASFFNRATLTISEDRTNHNDLGSKPPSWPPLVCLDVNATTM